MSTHILATKLYIPLPRATGVPRPHLIERLNQGLRHRLTLISAPAGFGKTTLLASWLAAQQAPGAASVAWLSLDRGDGDLARFLTYLVVALREIAPQLGEGIPELANAPQPPRAELLLTPLLNEVAALPGECILILDDYHALDSQAVDGALAFMLEHLPPQLHLVIATREDPPLPLARLRAQSQLTEIRAPELRFSLGETTEFLNQMMGLNLLGEDIALLDARTEGWVAGLQLAALSLQGHHDAASMIRSFSGSHYFVLDYLLEEVLHQQPADVQTFLLRTAILDRMCGPLCEAVLGTPAAGQAVLEYLERANLFIVPLDSERRWYRYHHLFADLLRQRLAQRPADPSVDELHRRASAWFEQNDLQLEAFHHAAAANDIDRAERLMGGRGMPLHFHDTVAAITGWLGSLPAAVLDSRPSLWIKYAEILLVSGQTSGVDQKLLAAEAALQGAEMDAANRSLVGHIASARATLALTRYQVEEMQRQSRRALEYLRPDELTFRATANWAAAYAAYLQGDRAESGRAYAEALALGQAAGDTFTTILSAIGVGQVYECENQLYRAAETYQYVLQLAGDRPQQIIYEPHLGLARIYYEWNDLAAAERHGQQSLKLARQYDSVIDRFIVCEVFLARLRLAQGDVGGAAALLEQSTQAARQHNYVHRMPDIAAAQVPVLLRQGKLAAAAHLAQQHDLPLCRARVLLAQGDAASAVALLDAQRQQALARGWQDDLLRASVLQAVAYAACGEAAAARALLGAALELAEPGGFIGVFLDEGPPLQRLLQDTAPHSPAPDYARRVLAAFPPAPAKRAAQLILVEPLSERELEVLRHIAEGRTDQEIADRLCLSLYTVKVHARNIYGKLGVNKRMQAVAKAQELGILPHP